MKRSFYSSLFPMFISLFLIFAGCKKDEPTAPQNHLPKIESLTANPNTVLINTETTLTCIATDEDGDNLTITWAAKRGTFSNGVVGVAVKWVAPSTAGTDTITVTINDGKQTLQGKLYIVVGTISASPALLTPGNNATEIDLSPTLTWSAASNAVSYTLQVSASNSFSSSVFNQNGLVNASQQISGLNPNTTYYWRVNSSNNYGTSGWSSVFSFKTLAPPQAPTLLTPANSSNDVPLLAALSWHALSNATSYSLQVSVSNSFATYFYNQSGLTTTSQIIPALGNFTKYYWRVRASNFYGTSDWSSTWSFTTTFVCGTQILYAGKTYNTVQIENQCWLKENLDAGEMIQVNRNPSNNTTIEKYCYDNKIENCNIYGGLYQWNEAMAYSITSSTKGICPDGFHLPTKSEFETLGAAVNNNSKALKEIGQGDGTNTSSFSGLLSGYRINGSSFSGLHASTRFWCSSEYASDYAYFMFLNSTDSRILLGFYVMDNGYSVRCVKD